MIGLYRDDGLAALEGTKVQIDRIRKKIEKTFKEYNLKLDDIEVGKKVNYLDVVLNLEDGTHKPYRKPNNTPKYIHVNLNHPKRIIEQIPKWLIIGYRSYLAAKRNSMKLRMYTNRPWTMLVTNSSLNISHPLKTQQNALEIEKET